MRSRPAGRPADNPSALDPGHKVSDEKLNYVENKAGNNSPTSYQEASGAPVEVNSPLGYSVGAITIVFLNLSKMIGTGIFSTRRSLEVFQTYVRD